MSYMYCDISGDVRGPMSEEEFVVLCTNGTISLDTKIMNEATMDNWTSFRDSTIGQSFLAASNGASETAGIALNAMSLSSIATDACHVVPPQLNRQLSCPTDLENFINLGYPEYLVLYALSTTNGDKQAAARILKNNGIIDNNDALWRGESDVDWISGVSSTGLPNIVENRALWKSPIYIRVSSFKCFGNEDEATFQTNVLMQDKRNWTVERTFEEFIALKNSLPLGTCGALKNKFPGWTIFRQFTPKFLEQRRRDLEEWLRELVLDEKCITNPRILNAVYGFVEVDDNGGPVSVEQTQKVQRQTINRFSATACLSVNVKDIPTVAILHPMTVDELIARLPLKCSATAYMTKPAVIGAPRRTQSGGESEGEEDAILRQLRKDYSRDRLVVQGHRILGSHNTFEELLLECRTAMTAVVNRFGVECPLAAHLLVGDRSGGGGGGGGVIAAAGAGSVNPRFSTALSSSSSSSSSAAPQSAVATHLSSSAAGGHRAVQLSPRTADALCQRLLWDLSRTESAALSHACLLQTVITSHQNHSHNNNNNSKHEGCAGDSGGSGDCDDEVSTLLIVPESRLARPIELVFSVSERRASIASSPAESTAAQWSLVAEGQAETVFRVIDSATMNNVMQIRVTYRKIMFGMPLGGGGVPGAEVELDIKDGKATLCLQRDTMTTQRDWRGDQHL